MHCECDVARLIRNVLLENAAEMIAHRCAPHDLILLLGDDFELLRQLQVLLTNHFRSVFSTAVWSRHDQGRDVHVEKADLVLLVEMPYSGSNLSIKVLSDRRGTMRGMTLGMRVEVVDAAD